MLLASLKNISIIFSKPIDISTAEGRAHERTRRIALTAITAVISKVLSIIIPLITVKLTLDYLGVELYGLWNATVSFFAIFVFADLGLGNGLQTQLSRAYGLNDLSLQKRIVYNSYVILSIIAVGLVVLFAFISPFIDWASILNARDATARNVLMAFIVAIIIPKFCAIPLSLIQRVQLAYQEGYNSNLWQCGASLLSLIGILIVTKYDLGKVSLIWVYSLIPVIIFFLNSITYYSKKSLSFFNRNNLDYSLIKNLFINGSAFFILSILTTIGLSVDTFIVAHVGNLSDATPYSILYRIAGMISVVVGMLCTPLWTANGEAFARGEHKWVLQNTIKVVRMTFIFSFLISIILISFSKLFFKLWLGQDFDFSLFCLAGMCVTQIILSVASPFFMVLNAANIIKKQIYIFLLFTSISFILKFSITPYFGVNIIPWINNLCYLIIVLPYIIHLTVKYIKSLK